MTYLDHAHRILEIIQDYAPSQTERDICEKLYDEMKDELSEQELMLQMARHLLDGLEFGNWPWCY